MWYFHIAPPSAEFSGTGGTYALTCNPTPPVALTEVVAFYDTIEDVLAVIKSNRKGRFKMVNLKCVS